MLEIYINLQTHATFSPSIFQIKKSHALLNAGSFFWIHPFFSTGGTGRSGEISQEEIDDIDLKLSQARTVAFVSLVFCDSWRRIEWLASLVMGLVRFRMATGVMMDIDIDCNCHPVIQCFYVV